MECWLIVGLGPQFESSSENFLDEEITGKALLTINAEYLNELSVSCSYVMALEVFIKYSGKSHVLIKSWSSLSS